MQARTGTRAPARERARTQGTRPHEDAARMHTRGRERAHTHGDAHAPTRSLPDTSETLPRFREEQPEDARSTEKAKLPVTARGARGSGLPFRSPGLAHVWHSACADARRLPACLAGSRSGRSCTFPLLLPRQGSARAAPLLLSLDVP